MMPFLALLLLTLAGADEGTATLSFTLLPGQGSYGSQPGGPYLPGEIVPIDLAVSSQVPNTAAPFKLRLDIRESDARLLFLPFHFDLTSVCQYNPISYHDYPSPYYTYYKIQCNSGTIGPEPASIASFSVRLPQIAGDYLVDVFGPPPVNTLYEARLWLTVAYSDCNANGINDVVDVATGASNDCNQNGLPDECDVDEPDLVLSFGYLASVGERDIAVADLDGDGDLDIASGRSQTFGSNTYYYVTRILNLGDGSFGPVNSASSSSPLVFSRGVAAEDFDDDGDVDIVTINYNRMAVFRNQGNGDFLAPEIFAIPISSFLASGDLNGDGLPDLVTINTTSGAILFNTGNAMFASGGNLTLPYGATDSAYHSRVSIADINNDTMPDIVVASRDFFSFFLNQGAGAFSPVTSIPLPNPANMLQVGDLDGDGDLDAVISTELAGNRLYVLKNAGEGSFEAPVEYDIGYPCQWIALGDMDGDDHLDIVSTSNGPGESDIAVLRNDGVGNFGSPMRFMAGRSNGIQAADFNGDGRTDLVLIQDVQDVGVLFRVSIVKNLTEPRGATDCNENGIPDECDIVRNPDLDMDGNSIMDFCQPKIYHGQGWPEETRPYSGFIDPLAESTDGASLDLGLMRFVLTFDRAVFSASGGPVTAADFELRITPPSDLPPPAITHISNDQNGYLSITVNHPLPPRHWMTIRANVRDIEGDPVLSFGDLGPGMDEPDRVDVGFLPGDVDQDGVVTPRDLLQFKRYSYLHVSPEMGIHFDFVNIDRAGASDGDAGDLLRLRQLVNGEPPSTQTWAGVRMLAPQP